MFDDIFDEMKRIMNKKFDGFDNFFTDEFLEDQLDKDQNKNTHKKTFKKEEQPILFNFLRIFYWNEGTENYCKRGS